MPEDKKEQLAKGEISFADARILATSNTTAKPNEGTEKSNMVTTVTIEQLEVYKLFQKAGKPTLQAVYDAMRKDLAVLRSALA